MVWGQNQNQQNYVGQMGMGNMNMQGMGSLGMGAGGRGILGEPPVSGSNMGISGLNNMQGMMGSSSSDNIDTMIQQRRLQQQLSLRESQLALASNLLQKQNQLIMDVGMPGNIGPMLPSPPGMSRSMIPSLLDMPSRHNKRSVPSMNRDLDLKRRRRDSSSPSDHQRGRNRSSDFDRRRDLDRYSPSRRREEHTSRRDRPSRFSRRDSDELPHRRSRNEHEEYDPAKPTDDEMPGLELADKYRFDDRAQRNFRDHMSSTRHKDRMSDVLKVTSKKSSHVEARLKAQEHLKRIESTRVGFCKVCDQELGIPFLRHKLTTLHKKREMQVRKGCGWCGVTNFLNFSEVLKHRERQVHKENAAKYGKKPEVNSDTRRTDMRSGRSSNLVTVDSVGYSPNGEDRRSRPRTAGRPGYSSRSSTSGRSETSRSGTSRSATSAKSDTKEVDLCPELQFEAETAIGQNYVIPVSGFFCKLCHKFYNTETAAKVTHCQSQAHFTMFKKAKNAAKARALAQKKTSTPVGTEDETKPVKEDTDSAQAEQEGEEKDGEEQEAAEKTDEGLEEAENQNGENEDAKGPNESEDGQGETEEGQGETEEGQGQASEAAEEFDQDEEANGGMKAEADDYPEEDEKHLTEEEQEEKLLEKDDNESETGEMLGDMFADDDEDDTAIIDLADVSSEAAGDEKDTELSVQESEEAAEQVDEVVEEAPAADTSPVVKGRGRGRGRGVGRRGRRGRK